MMMMTGLHLVTNSGLNKIGLAQLDDRLGIETRLWEHGNDGKHIHECKLCTEFGASGISRMCNMKWNEQTTRNVFACVSF